MPLKRFYWITSEKFPEGYAHELPVFAALRARGIEVRPTVWDRDPVPRPASGEAIIVRTPWDYLAKIERFRDWMAQLPPDRVQNSAKVLRWNSEKTYLRELERSGVRLVPTHWMNAASESEVASASDAAFPGRRRIVKPVLSAGSLDTFRLDPGERPPTGVFVGRPAMIQPYLEEIETDGERSLVYFSGKFSHAVRKRPRPGEFRVQESFGGLFSEFRPNAEETLFGDRAIAAIRARFPDEPAPLYARVDYVLVAGIPHLMEAELLEPDLFLHHASGSAERFVEALTALSD